MEKIKRSYCHNNHILRSYKRGVATYNQSTIAKYYIMNLVVLCFLLLLDHSQFVHISRCYKNHSKRHSTGNGEYLS